MKRVLIVSPYFPPSTLAGVHRARILAKYLPSCGWEPVIFCVDHSYHEQRLDPDLGAMVSRETRVMKVPAWPTKLCRAFGIGDLGIRGYMGLRSALHDFIERAGADLLLITALPGIPLLLGPGIKRRYGIPFVADYQDPWLPADHRSTPAFTKTWLMNFLAAAVEPYVLKRVDHVTAVSDLTNELIRSRHPWIVRGDFSTVPIGGDLQDFEWLKSNPRHCPWTERTGDEIFISYVGNVWPNAYKTLEALFAAVALLKRENPQLYGRLHLLFVGSSNQAVDSVQEVVMPFARQAGIEAIVREEPSRIAYLDALNVMQRSDILLMIGSDHPHYSASKLVPSFLARRPILGIFHAESNVCSIAGDVGGMHLIRFASERPVETVVPEIARAIEMLAATPDRAGHANLDRLEPLLGPAIARQFGKLFQDVLNQRRRAESCASA